MHFRRTLASLALGAAAMTAPAMAADDPYQWLEEWTTPRAMEWVGAHNDVTVKRLTADKRYATLYDEALAIAGAKDRIPSPAFVNGRIMNFWQDQDHLRGIWRATTLDDYRNAAPAWKTLLDIDALGKAEGKSWVFKGAACLKPEERLCMVSLSDGGEDAVEMREFDLITGQFVSGGFHLPRGKHRIAWEDADHLLVATDWDSQSLTPSGYPFIVKRLARGAALSSAVDVYRGQKTDGGYGVSPYVLRDGAGHQLVAFSRPLDTFHSETWVLTPRGVEKLDIPSKVAPAEMVAGRVVIQLDEDWKAANGTFGAGSLVDVPLPALLAAPGKLKPALVWQPGPRDALERVSASKDRLLLTTLSNVNGKLLSLAPRPSGGWSVTPLALPDKLALSFGSADEASNRAFATVTGFTTPTTMYLTNAATGKATLVKSLPPKFDATGLVVDQFEATSSDGTKVPYFLVHRRDRPMDGSTPTLLNAYGGFQVSSTPVYSGVTGKLWLERGGAFVLANIRGGGEFGPKWHEAALKTRRQIAYDDFAAVARDLIARKVTSSRRLGIEGGSNGGLLMGVQFTQHPELWNAVVIQVPLLDMIRIGKIAAGASWQGEYGDVEAEPDARAFWEKVSPYHQLKAGVKYPEPFIFTTTKDDRVGPQHARKFAAKMEGMGLPFMYYENTEGGHGSGADIKQSAKINALTMTYLIEKLMD
ncbi:MAG: S9 family peptidase [Novosphingobium sp.]|nr:S9 family peptidase [Novosphingobium sp.]